MMTGIMWTLPFAFGRLGIACTGISHPGIARSGATRQPSRHCALVTRLLRFARNDRGASGPVTSSLRFVRNDRGASHCALVTRLLRFADRGARTNARVGGLAFALALLALATAPHAARAVEPRIVFDLANSKWTVQED